MMENPCKGIHCATPTFIVIMGGSASGKTHYANEWHIHLPLIDIDSIILEIADGDVNADRTKMVSPAIREMRTRMDHLFEFQQTFVHTTTGSNLKGLLNKFILAKEHGFATHLTLIETSDTIAIGRNLDRVEKGGHGGTLTGWKIAQTNRYAKENFMRLMNFDCVDYSRTYNND